MLWPRRDRHVVPAVLAAGLVATAVTGGTLVLPGKATAGTPVPGASGCPMFPADNVWNTDISALPVDPHSPQWMASMNASSTRLHPDFGPSYGAQPVPYGIPFTTVDSSHPKVSISFQYADESDPGPYPFGSDTPIEGGPNASGDRHAIMVDNSTCTLYELFDANYSSSGSTAGSGAIWSLKSDALRPAGWTSADAAGLPILPGLLRPDEVAAGSVSHAIRFTAARTDRSYLWPARHQAGDASDSSLPPMGARFRLKANFDISSFSAPAQVVLRAMQHYGLILADNGSNWYFQGSADNSWDINLIDELKQVPAAAFEAVDESSLMVQPDSAQARLAPPTAGYHLVAADGGIFSFGLARYFGSTGGTHLAAPVVGVAPTADGRGYWLVASDGGVFTFGNANFAGSAGSLPLAAPIVGMARTSDGSGYWLVASDGGVFNYGHAAFHGSTGGTHLVAPIVGMAATPDGGGYWLVASDGGIFTFGDAGFHGSAGALNLQAPVVGMEATPDGGGYWLVASDGGIFSYGDAAYEGSTGGVNLVAPIVGIG